MGMENALSYEAPVWGEVFARCPGKGSLLSVKKARSASTVLRVQLPQVLWCKWIFPRYQGLTLSQLGPRLLRQESSGGCTSVSLQVSCQYHRCLSMFSQQLGPADGFKCCCEAFWLSVCLELSRITQTCFILEKTLKAVNQTQPILQTL